MEKLYHITDSESVQSILKNGLIPAIGNNSKLNSEKEDNVYLCEYNDIWLWKLRLDKNAVLEVDIDDKDDLSYTEYYNICNCLYKEYICHDKINPKNIRLVTINQPIDMQKITKMAIISVTKIMKLILRYYNNYSNLILQNKIKHNLLIFAKTYSVVDPEWIYQNDKEVFDLLKLISLSGYNTFLDRIGDTNINLYKIIPIIAADTPDTELSKLLMELYNWINTRFGKYTFKTNIGICDKFKMLEGDSYE